MSPLAVVFPNGVDPGVLWNGDWRESEPGYRDARPGLESPVLKRLLHIAVDTF